MSEYVCGYRIVFKDGREETLVLRRGTDEECRRALTFAPGQFAPGLSDSAERPLDHADLFLITKEHFEEHNG